MQKNSDIKKIVQQAVRETLTGLGFNANDPTEIQADLLYLRKMRRGSEEMSRLAKRCIITVTIPAFLYMAWEVIKRSLSE